jgi:hypothetical protein
MHHRGIRQPAGRGTARCGQAMVEELPNGAVVEFAAHLQRKRKNS